MKNFFFFSIAFLLMSLGVSAQSTVDSIKSKYQLQTMPEPMTIEKTFPVLGTYQLTTADGSSKNVSVTLDAENKGIIWVEGLPQGKFKAFLRKSPGIYRITSQLTDGGKQIPEGTLMFDAEANKLNIALGKKFDVADPVAIFNMNGSADADAPAVTEVKIKSKKGNTKTKTKTKVMFYTATKVLAETSTPTGTGM